MDNEIYRTTRQKTETIYSSRNSNHVNGISYKLPHIWLPPVNLSRTAIDCVLSASSHGDRKLIQPIGKMQHFQTGLVISISLYSMLENGKNISCDVHNINKPIQVKVNSALRALYKISHSLSRVAFSFHYLRATVQAALHTLLATLAGLGYKRPRRRQLIFNSANETCFPNICYCHDII